MFPPPAASAAELSQFGVWYHTLTKLHDLVTQTANSSGVEAAPDALAARLVAAVHEAYPHSVKMTPSPPHTPVPLDHTLSMPALFEGAETTSTFVHDCLFKNPSGQAILAGRVRDTWRSSQAILAEKVRDASRSITSGLIERFKKFEERGNLYGLVTFRVDGRSTLLLKYGDYGMGHITTAIELMWPQATELAFHKNVSTVDVHELDLTRVYKCRKGWMGYYIQHYDDLGADEVAPTA